MSHPPRSMFKPLLDGMAEAAPLPIIACMLVDVITKVKGVDDRSAEKALWACWETLAEFMAQPEVTDKMTRGQKLAAAFLTGYFGESGDWEKMRQAFRKKACERLPGMVVDAILAKLGAGISAEVERQFKKQETPKC